MLPYHTVHRFADLEALSRHAAEAFVRTARAAVAERGRFLVVLAGGGTPAPLYRLLTKTPYAETMPWAHTHFFWGDERIVPPDHAESNYGQAKRLLLDPARVPETNVHRVRGEWDVARACRDYTDRLAQFTDPETPGPRFDLVLLGMGSDGHTASLFPGPISEAEANRPVIAVTAQYAGRPAQRVTLTPLALNAARAVIVLVAGTNKAEVLANVLTGAYHPVRYPIQRVHPYAGTLTWLVGAEAAGG